MEKEDMFALRRANAEDLIAAAQVSERAFLSIRDVYRPTADAIAKKEGSAPSYEQLVGTWEGQLAATVEYRLSPESLDVRALAVDPECQRRGIARLMIDGLVAIARENGRRAVTLFTIRETGNVAIFERMGFHVISEERASWCESDRHETLHEARMERGVT